MAAFNFELPHVRVSNRSKGIIGQRTLICNHFTQTFLPLLLAMVFVSLACSDNTSAPCRDLELGALEGYITVAGEGALISIGAESYEDSQPFDLIYRSQSDSSGWYHLELSNGFID